MRIPFLVLALLAIPASAAAQQGPRRGAPVPARAVREAEAGRVTPVVAAPAGSAAAFRAAPARPPKRPSRG